MYYEYSYEMPPGLIALSLILSVIGLIAMWRIFVKADQPGWAVLIPIYNVYVMFKIVWGSGWKFLLCLIPLVNIVIAIMHVFKLARAFGKGTGFGFGLLFLLPIFTLILAFGDAKYVGPQ